MEHAIQSLLCVSKVFWHGCFISDYMMLIDCITWKIHFYTYSVVFFNVIGFLIQYINSRLIPYFFKFLRNRSILDTIELPAG